MSDVEQEMERLHAEVDTLGFPAFDVEAAWRLGCLIRKMAAERSLPIAIDIRMGEQQVFHAALPGASAENDSWAARKAGLVRYTNKASYPQMLGHRAAGAAFPAHLDPRLVAYAGGCVPIRVGTALVGTVAVSGLPDADDHALVVEAIRSFLVS